MARRRFLGAMQARIACVARRRRQFTRFRRLRDAVSICSRIAAPRFYVRLYARRLRAARVAYDVACDAAAATDAAPALAAVARAAAAGTCAPAVPPASSDRTLKDFHRGQGHRDRANTFSRCRPLESGVRSVWSRATKPLTQ